MSRPFGPTGPWGPFDLPLGEIPDGGQATIADLSRLHYSSKYGWHYDATLIERHGGRFDQLDKMHIDRQGNIIDPHG